MKAIVYVDGGGYDTQVQMDKIVAVHYDYNNGHVDVVTTGGTFSINVTDSGDALAVINQINAAYDSMFSINRIVGNPTIPSAPTGLTATADYGRISLSWNKPAPTWYPWQYNVYRSTDGGVTYSYLGTSGTSQSYVDDGLSLGIDYYYKVAAFNSRGESAQSTADHAQSLTPPTPSAPNAAADSIAYGVLIDWTATTPPAYEYLVYRDGVDYLGQTSGLTFYDIVADGLPHTYTVVCKINGVESPQSAASSSVTAVQLTAPTGLAVVAGYYNMSLTWDAVAGAASYNVYRNGLLLVSGVNTNSYTNNSLSYEEGYYYSVSASSNGIDGAQCADSAPQSPNQIPAISAFPSSIPSATGGEVNFIGTGISGEQNGLIAYGIGAINYIQVSYDPLGGSMTAVFPAGLSAGTVPVYYVVNGDLNIATTVNTNITFTP